MSPPDPDRPKPAPLPPEIEAAHIQQRFDRQFQFLGRSIPMMDRPLRWLRSPALTLIRIPIAILFILGGMLAILPIFGLWMIPVGLLLLAIDVPRLQGPVAAGMIRGRRRIQRFRTRGRPAPPDDPAP